MEHIIYSTTNIPTSRRKRSPVTETLSENSSVRLTIRNGGENLRSNKEKENDRKRKKHEANLGGQT